MKRGTADRRQTSLIMYESRTRFCENQWAAYFFTTITTKLMIAITSDSNSKSVISASFIYVSEESGSNAS